MKNAMIRITIFDDGHTCFETCQQLTGGQLKEATARALVTILEALKETASAGGYNPKAIVDEFLAEFAKQFLEGGAELQDGSSVVVRDPDNLGYPADWPKCPGCGRPALDGHITCGEAACNEGGRRHGQ